KGCLKRRLSAEGGRIPGSLGQIDGCLKAVRACSLGEGRVEKGGREDAVHATSERQISPVLRLEVDDRRIPVGLVAAAYLIPSRAGRNRSRIRVLQRAVLQPEELIRVANVV